MKVLTLVVIFAVWGINAYVGNDLDFLDVGYIPGMPIMPDPAAPQAQPQYPAYPSYAQYPVNYQAQPAYAPQALQPGYAPQMTQYAQPPRFMAVPVAAPMQAAPTVIPGPRFQQLRAARRVEAEDIDGAALPEGDIKEDGAPPPESDDGAASPQSANPVLPENKIPKGDPDSDKDPKLVAALEAIKGDLMAKGHQVREEEKWLLDVANMSKVYEGKQLNVQKSVEKLRKEMMDLLKKKRQIENLELQNALQQKMAIAKDDLNSLDVVLGHVSSRAEQFSEKKANVEATIADLKAQLEALKNGGPNAEEVKEAETDAQKVMDEQKGRK